jgi:hypothetical protein
MAVDRHGEIRHERVDDEQRGVRVADGLLDRVHVNGQ